MKRRLLRWSLTVVIDFMMLSAAFVAAFLFRFEFDLSLDSTKLLFFTMPYVVILEYASLAILDVPRVAWSYFASREAWLVLRASLMATAVLVGLRLFLGPLGGYAQFVSIPLGVLAMNFVLSVCAIIGVRMIRRSMVERPSARQAVIPDRPAPRRTLLVGAGRAGAAVARELTHRPDLGVALVGFVDDDEVKLGSSIHGVRVLGSTDDIATISRESEATDVIISIARATGREVRRITRHCQDADLDTRIIPGLSELVGGQVNLSALRPVAIEDLLRREPVELDAEGISGVVRGQVVMVTGAGGSIGSELVRQICRWEPAKVVLYERSENALFHVHQEVLTLHPELQAAPRMGDVTDAARLDAVMAEHTPTVVLHAAAHKHVPMMEWNPGEAVKNNVLGTWTCAKAAHRWGVRNFVLISTDKAVNPSSIMGATKRVAELCVHAVAQQGDTRFVAVRFGNVLGSDGSVVPTFHRQIAAGGPVTVTHRDMTRYFMTIPEACQLVLQSAALGAGGELFILDMGEPVLIRDLAVDLIRLSGLVPHEDVEIVYSGLRPGEKLFEELSTEDEHLEPTGHPKILRGRLQGPEGVDVLQQAQKLIDMAMAGADIEADLLKLVPDYRRPSRDGPEGGPTPGDPGTSETRVARTGTQG